MLKRLGGRKNVAFIFILVLSTFMLMIGKVGGEVWSGLIIFGFGLFIEGNVRSKKYENNSRD